MAQPTTLAEGVELIRSLPSWSVVVLDTLDSADLPGPLTSNRSAYSYAWRGITDMASTLIRRKISLLLLSQIRYLGHGVGSSAWYIRKFLTAAVALRPVKSESEFGKKTWKHTQLRCTRDRRARQKYSDVIYFHPELGYCPELEVLQYLAKVHGPGWRKVLGVTVPTSRIGAVTQLRYDPELLDYLWRKLWPESEK